MNGGDDVWIRFRADTSAAERDAAAGGERGGEGFLSGLTGKIGMGAAALAAAGAAAGVAVAAGLKEAIDQELSSDLLAAQLGLSAEESERYGALAGRLYADAYGESFGEVNDAIGSVVSSIAGMREASDAEVQAATESVLNFASAFGTDVARSSQIAGQLISTGLAKDATEAFDLITAASQRVPAALREDFLDAGDEYGQFFATLGFSGEQAFAVLVEGAEKGMYGIDKAGDAIKEFTIRATDMSTSTQEALGTIGLDAGKMGDDILAGGDRARDAFQTILDKFNELPDGTKKANAAIALFGTPLEDLSVAGIPEFIESLGGGSDAMEGFGGAAERMGETINDNAATRIEAFKRRVTQSFVTFLGDEVLPRMAEFSQFTSDTFGPAVARIGDLFSSEASPRIQEYVSVLSDAVLPALTRLVAYVRADVVPALAELGAWIAENVVPVLESMWVYMTESLLPALEAFAGWIVDEVVPAVVDLAEKVAENMVPILETAFQVIQEQVIPTLESLVAWIMDELVPALEPLAERIGQVVGWLIEFASVVAREVLPPLIEFGGWLIENLVPIAQDVVLWIVNMVTAVVEMAFAFGEIIGNIWGFGEALIGGVVDAANEVYDAVTELPGKIADLAGDMLEAGKEMMGGFVDGLLGVGDAALDIAESIWGAFKGLVNDFLIDPLNDFLTSSISFGPLGSIQIFEDPPIPHLARGTDAFPGGYAWVGEEGPELVRMAAGTQVYPADVSQRMAGAGAAGTTINIGTMMPHDYNDFTRQMDDEKRLAALGGRGR